MATLLGAAVVVYAGIYDVGADVPHWRAVSALLDVARERSIAARSHGIVAPPLDSRHLIGEGAEHYAAMCSGCHLAPGLEDTEIRAGLYPRPPDLSRGTGVTPEEQFWVIKHGIKFTAMPAWGATHDDEAIWGLVAFIEKLPTLSAEEYATLTNNTGGPSNSNHDEAGESEPIETHHRHELARPDHVGHTQ